MTPAERFSRLVLTQPGSDLKRNTVRAGTSAMVAEAVEFILRLVSIIVLARLLVPEHFGLIAMVTAITSIAERFKDLGLSIATVQRAEITHEQVSTLFWVNTGVGVGLMLLVAALAAPIAHFYGDSRLLPVTLAIASGFLLGGLSVQHQALMRRQMQYGRIATIQIVSSAASIVVAVVLALADFGYWALVAREVSRGVFLTVGSWIGMPWIPGLPHRRSGVRSMLAFGGNVTGFNLIAFLCLNLDQIIIGKLFGATPLGLYRQGVNLVLSPITQLTYPANSVAESALSRLQAEPHRYRQYYTRILELLSLVTMPMATFVAVFSEEIVLVALGDKWLAAAQYFRILALAVFVRPALATIGSVIVSEGRSARYFWWGLAAHALLAALLLLGSQWGATGVAYAHVVWTYLWLWPCIYWGLKDSPVSMADFARAVYRPVVASLVMAVALEALRTVLAGRHPGAAAMLSWGLLAGLLVYLAAWLALPGGRAELHLMWKQFREAVRPVQSVATT